MVVALEIHPCPSPKQSVLESPQMLSISEGDRALDLQSYLEKQGQISKPEATEFLHLSSYSNDSSFRDEKSPLTQHRRLTYGRLIPLCAMAKSTSGLMPGVGGKTARLMHPGHIPICGAYCGFLGEVSKQSVDTMDLVSSRGFSCESS